MRLKLAAVAVLAVVLVGCDDKKTRANLEVTDEALAAAIDALEAAKADLEAQKAAGVPVSDKAIAGLSQVIEAAKPAGNAVSQWNNDVAAGADPIAAGAAAVAPFLPPPYGTIAAVGVPAILGLIAAFRERKKANANKEAARAAVAAVYMGGSPATLAKLHEQADAKDWKVINDIAVADNLNQSAD